MPEASGTAAMLAGAFYGERGLAAVPEPRAARSDVDVGAGGLSRHRVAERVERNVAAGDANPPPAALRGIGVDGRVRAAAVVDPEGAMDGRLAAGAHGQGIAEPAREGGLDPGKLGRGEDPIA